MTEEVLDPQDDRVISGRAFGNQVLKVLGLEGKHVQAFTIEVHPMKPALVKIERMLTWGETEALLPVIEEYQLLREVTDLESSSREYVEP